MKLLEDDEIQQAVIDWCNVDIDVEDEDRAIVKATGKKILIELQAIYKLPDLKMEHDRMGEFIQSLQEEVNG